MQDGTWDLHDDDPVEDVGQHEPYRHARRVSPRHIGEAHFVRMSMTHHAPVLVSVEALLKDPGTGTSFGARVSI